MPRKRRTASADPLRELAWEEIAGEIAPPPSGRCLCLGIDFARYLQRRIAFPSPPEVRGTDGPVEYPAGDFVRIFGWRGLEGKGAATTVAMIHRSLAEGGEGVLFGYCRFPGRDDLASWRVVCREKGMDFDPAAFLQGALSLSRIAALLAEGPFERYSIRMKGIWYKVNLHR